MSLFNAYIAILYRTILNWTFIERCTQYNMQLKLKANSIGYTKVREGRGWGGEGNLSNSLYNKTVPQTPRHTDKAGSRGAFAPKKVKYLHSTANVARAFWGRPIPLLNTQKNVN